MSDLPKRKIGKPPGAARRRTVGSSPTAWVRVAPLLEDSDLPVVVRPAVDGMDLVSWASQQRDHIDALLLEHRALLFRGFGVDSVEERWQVHRPPLVLRRCDDRKRLVAVHLGRPMPRPVFGDGGDPALLEPVDRGRDHVADEAGIRTVRTISDDANV